METSYLELRNKEVINVVDGSLLGRIIDVVFDIRTSRVLGFIVPGVRCFFNIFKSCPEVFVPYKNICKIGDDVILVEVFNVPKNNRGKKTTILKEEGAIEETGKNLLESEDFLNQWQIYKNILQAIIYLLYYI